MTTRQPSVTTAASTATLTVNCDTTDQACLTAQAAALTVAAPTGTASNGQKLTLRFKDNGVARAITWNAVFRDMGAGKPTTTTISKTMYVGCIYSAADSTWDIVSVAQQP